MNREEVIKALTVLQTAYPMFYRNQTSEQIRDTAQLWLSAFKDKDGELVNTAVMALINTRTETYPPNIGAVNEMIQKLTAPELTPLEAWGYVRNALRNGIYGAEDEWERFPEPVKLAITPQQIRAWAVDDDFNEDVASSNFMRSFQERRKNEREMNMLPESIRSMARIAMEKMTEPKMIERKPSPTQKRFPPVDGGNENKSLRERLLECRKETTK